MTDYYGSCSGCDSWEGCGDDDARKLILGLCGSAKQFPDRAAAAAWTKNIDEKEKPWEFPWTAASNLKLDV